MKEYMAETNFVFDSSASCDVNNFLVNSENIAEV